MTLRDKGYQDGRNSYGIRAIPDSRPGYAARQVRIGPPDYTLASDDPEYLEGYAAGRKAGPPGSIEPS